jgi:hypothetical protein
MKDDCYTCKSKKWCIDFKGGNLAYLMRKSTCLLCDLKEETAALKGKLDTFRMKKARNVKLKSNLKPYF